VFIISYPEREMAGVSFIWFCHLLSTLVLYCDSSAYFQLYANSRALPDNMTVLTVNTVSTTDCVSICDRTSDCNSAIYNVDQRVCQLSEATALLVATKGIASTGSRIFTRGLSIYFTKAYSFVVLCLQCVAMCKCFIEFSLCIGLIAYVFFVTEVDTVMVSTYFSVITIKK